ncbi:MAG: cytochrome c3 family protein [Ignavibacteria bacterium]|nr:cytochrome c3 family protein [Ignavibacteria bacterium]
MKLFLNSIFLMLFSICLFAQGKKIADNSVCLSCHDDPTITMERNGKTISLEVKKHIFSTSVHSSLTCDKCHINFNPDEIPHSPKIEPVNCLSCHKNASQTHKFHPRIAFASGTGGTDDVNCKKCHGYHNVSSPKKLGSRTHFLNSTNFCGGCHEKERDLHIKSEHSVHLSKDNPNAPTCIFCHQMPITKGNKLPIVQLKLNQEKLCLTCHIKQVENPFAKTLIDYDKSVHGSALRKGNQNSAGCIDCHGSHDLQKVDAPTSRIHPTKVSEICGKCHVAITQEYHSSIHGIELVKGNQDVPGCTYCHGEHAISPMAKVEQRIIEANRMNFRTLVSNQMVFCVRCHTNDTLMNKYNLSTLAKAHDWLPNLEAHWETVRCVDCHSSYEPPNLSHNILSREATVKKCEECHSKNSILMTKLYKHEKEQSREKYGFINGTILSDAYVIASTRNVYLDFFGVALFSAMIVLILLHSFLRWYFRPSKNTVTEQKDSEIKDIMEKSD